MYEPNAPLVTMKDIEKARDVLQSSPNFVVTPMLKNCEKVFSVESGISLYMKLENTQVTGSFKVRGIINQMASLPQGYGTKDRPLISMSAGNYGKSFAFIAHQMGLVGTIVMPDTAPDNRASLIESYGISVERGSSSQIQNIVDKHVRDDNMIFLHSFDDSKVIAGHGSAGLEILEEVAEPDVVLVCCGGGGLVSGIATAVKESGNTHCRIYAVEPEGSRTMYESFRQDRPVSMEVKSVASGLSPPYAGSNTFKQCKKYVEDVLLVTDEELVESMFFLHNHGLYVEPSGVAAFAALRHQKVPDMDGKNVVVVLTGGNVTPEELVQIKEQFRDKKVLKK